MRGILMRRDVFQDNAKFIPSETSYGVIAAHTVLKTVGKCFEECIPCSMPHGVIDNLEAIEVDKHYPGFPAFALAELNGMPQAIVKHHAVGQPGEKIILSQLFEFLFRYLAFGYVLGNIYQALGKTVTILEQAG